MRAARVVVALTAFAAFAACGGKPGKSICDNTVPPPAVCMSQCDPSPAAPNTCPSGFHCAPDGFCDARCTPGGGECGDGYECTADGRCKGEGECEGLECNITDCAKQGKPETTISGTIYAPNGTLPLYGIDVYVPNQPLPPVTDGAECARCNENLPGNPIVRGRTDEAGKFTISGAPSGQSIPIVISSGKWRREIMLPAVAECADTVIPATDSRLPKNKSEGSIPKIAITTGNADALECLLPKLGIDLAEITTSAGAGRVHLYTNEDSGGQGADQIMGGGTMTDAQGLWESEANLKQYDIVILSCEGNQYPDTKSQNAMNAMKAYADFGGRVFMSHWHNIWIEGAISGNGQAPQVWTGIATWSNGGNLTTVTDIVDENSNPKGTSFATWLLNVGASTVRGEITVNEARTTVEDVDPAKAERWVYLNQNGMQLPQMFQFSTPNEAPAADRCGKVQFSDMHVSAGSSSPTGSPGFPDGCNNNPLSPQEKALAFMFFDLASCVSVIL